MEKLGPKIEVKQLEKSRSEKFSKIKSRTVRPLLAAVALTGLFSAACENMPESTDDGYTNRAVLHTVENPLNGDKYTSFEFRDRVTQDEDEINFHHLKSNPQKFERLVIDLEGLSKTVLNMEQVNVPLGDIEFQHSKISYIDPKTNLTDALYINRVKPISKEAPRFTAYSLFQGENRTNLGTIIFSDEQPNGGERGKTFVALKPGVFDFISTSERFANSYIDRVNSLMIELKQKNYNDERISQAVWEVEYKDKVRTMNGVIDGIPYKVVSRHDSAREIPGYNLNGKRFNSSEIFRSDGSRVAQVTTEHNKGTSDGDSVTFNFTVFTPEGEKRVMEFKRYFRDKSETQTSTGTGTTIGISTTGSVAVGWTTVNLETPVNFQDENILLHSYGRRDEELTDVEKQENMRKVSAILGLLAGTSILDGLNFQDSEIEWSQSSNRIISSANNGTMTSDMGYWLELPVDATETGISEALNLLISK